MIDADGVVPVSVAAEMLRVSPAHVRDLVDAGRLRAIRLGRELLVDVASVRHRQQVIQPRAGRPLSPRMAWALLYAISGRRPAWIGAVERGRIREHLRRSDLAQWPRLLGNRADVHRVRMLPGPLDKLLRSDVASAGGISAAAGYGVDLINAEGQAEVYLPAESFEELRNSRRLKVDAAEPNVLLRVLKFDPAVLDLDRVVPPAVVVADLVDSGDERSVKAARRLFDRLLREAGSRSASAESRSAPDER